MADKLIIFDLDGTLVDSSQDICSAINDTIMPLNAKAIDVSQTKELVGEGITTLMQKVLRELYSREPSNEELSNIVQVFKTHYRKQLTRYTCLYDGVLETLQGLPEFKKVIVTNKEKSMSDEIVKTLRIEQYFEFLVGPETVGAKKPSPLPLQHCMDKLKIPASHTVIVGDSVYDIEAGKLAGIKTIAVTYGFKAPETLKDADILINHMSELKPALKKLGLML